MGAYFSGMISKSANYCGAVNKIGFLLLCDVVLGTQKKHTNGLSDTDRIGHGIGPKEKYDSMWGVGATKPDPAGDVHMPEGYTIPLRKAITNQSRSERNPAFLCYNEFIVYDTDQIQVRNLVRADLG